MTTLTLRLAHGGPPWLVYDGFGRDSYFLGKMSSAAVVALVLREQRAGYRINLVGFTRLPLWAQREIQGKRAA